MPNVDYDLHDATSRWERALSRSIPTDPLPYEPRMGSKEDPVDLTGGDDDLELGKVSAE